MPETSQANVPVTTRGNVWYLHAVNGRQGKISVTPGNSCQGVESVAVLGKPGQVRHEWKEGTLNLDYPESDPATPHDVIVVTFRTTAGDTSKASAKK
jgi:hypothetical protein